MDNRGSKSIIYSLKIIVKEQRIDGSCANLALRYTPMDCVIIYQVKISSNQIYGKIQVRNFHATSAVRTELQNTQVIHP